VLETSDMSQQRRVLIADDNPAICSLVRVALEREDFSTLIAKDGAEALKLFAEHRVDFVILDILMPQRNGFIVCREIRRRSDVPILILTARDDTDDVVHGLELGADDYVTKPFEVKELVARIRAILARLDRQRQSEHPPILSVADVEVDRERYRVTVRGKDVRLTPTEMELLYCLMREPGRVYEREDLLRDVWGYDYFGKTNLVDVAVRRLRLKVERSASQPEYILTVRGVGYKFAGDRELHARVASFLQ